MKQTNNTFNLPEIEASKFLLEALQKQFPESITEQFEDCNSTFIGGSINIMDIDSNVMLYNICQEYGSIDEAKEDISNFKKEVSLRETEISQLMLQDAFVYWVA